MERYYPLHESDTEEQGDPEVTGEVAVVIVSFTLTETGRFVTCGPAWLSNSEGGAHTAKSSFLLPTPSTQLHQPTLVLPRSAMSRRKKSRNGKDKPVRPKRQQNLRLVSRTDNAQIDPPEDWVASPLLNAMDHMERHVQEMLDHNQPAAQTVPSGLTAAPDSTQTKAHNVREVKRRAEERVHDIMDTVVGARIRRLEAVQKLDQSCIDELQATRKHESQTLQDLDTLHRHEHVLNTALVERLFSAPSLQGHPDTRFDDTAFGLQGSDSVNSVLVSHVEALVMKVQRLEQEVRWMQVAMEERNSYQV